MGRPWILYGEVQHDKETNIHSFSWKGQRVSLVPLQPASSSSMEEPKREHKEDIGADIKKQDQREEDAMTKLDDTSHSTLTIDGTSKEFEDKKPDLFVKSGNQKMQAARELEASIEDLDMDSKEPKHTIDLIEVLLPNMPIESSENKSIIPKSSEEDQLVAVPHIHFIFGNQQWILGDCNLIL